MWISSVCPNFQSFVIQIAVNNYKKSEDNLSMKKMIHIY